MHAYKKLEPQIWAFIKKPSIFGNNRDPWTCSWIPSSNRFFWPEPIYRDINFVLKCLPAQCVTIFNLDQHSTQGNYLGQIFSPVSYHRPIIRNTNILSNSRTAHYLRPNIFFFLQDSPKCHQRHVCSARNAGDQPGSTLVRLGSSITMLTIIRETSRVCWVPTAACRI